MHGSLYFHRGVLYVGRYASTAHVRAYDLGGNALGAGFSFRGAEGGRASIRGLAVDDDRRIWIADDVAFGVRRFTQFGRELPGVVSRRPTENDAPGHLASVIGVAVGGVEREARVLIASAGRRRHALQLFTGEGEWVASLRPSGDPLGLFHGLVGVAVDGRTAYASDSAAGRIHVYRDGEFHFALSPSGFLAPHVRFIPHAAAPVGGGRLVIAHGDEADGGLDVVDQSGRLIRSLADHGEGAGEVFIPTAVAVHLEGCDRDTLIAVLDRDAERVQYFAADGRCFGELLGLPAGTEDGGSCLPAEHRASD